MARFPNKRFCVVDDQGKHFWVTISSRPPLWAGPSHRKKMKGAQIDGRIWLREGLDDDKTELVLRHEIAHPRVSRSRLYNPLHDKVIWGLVLVFLFGGFSVFLVTGSKSAGNVVSGLAFIGAFVKALYGISRTIDSKEHEMMVDEMAKKVNYTVHDHQSPRRMHGQSFRSLR